jgi:hypothetical protein
MHINYQRSDFKGFIEMRGNKKRNLIICKLTKHTIIFDQLETGRRLVVTVASHNDSDFGKHTHILSHSAIENASWFIFMKYFLMKAGNAFLISKPFLSWLDLFYDHYLQTWSSSGLNPSL